MELLQAVAKKGYKKQVLDLAYVHGVPLAEKGKVTELAPYKTQLQGPISYPFPCHPLPPCREAVLHCTWLQKMAMCSL